MVRRRSRGPWPGTERKDGGLPRSQRRRPLGGARPRRPRPGRLVRRSLARAPPAPWGRADEALGQAQAHQQGVVAEGALAPRLGIDVEQARAGAGHQHCQQPRQPSARRSLERRGRIPFGCGRDRLPELQLDSEGLAVDPAAAAFLGDWYGFAASVLEELRAESPGTAQPSRVQLWPEHFDLALELGNEEAGARAAYGLSPGDEDHDEPYLYVAPWVARPEGELWRAGDFSGAEMGYGELLAAGGDQRGTAIEFFAVRLAALSARAQ